MKKIVLVICAVISICLIAFGHIEFSTLMLTIFGLTYLLAFSLLQIYLTKKQNKFIGLILPIIAFLLPLVQIVMDKTPFLHLWTTTTYNNNGQPINNNPKLTIILALLNFLIENIPTIIFLIIYFVNKPNKQSEVSTFVESKC
ncbi:MAG: hypothetical protein WC677_03890 [Clostridia bacterium]|jgi:hypothetical protein